MPRKNAKKVNLMVSTNNLSRKIAKTNSISITANSGKPKRKAKTRQSGQRNRKNPSNVMTPGGIAFLKAATAAPDFETIDCTGVPDEYAGKSLIKRDYCNLPITVAPGKRAFIVVTPTPGICFWFGSEDVSAAPAGVNTTTLYSTMSGDATQLFDGFNYSEPDAGVKHRTNSGTVDKFRYIGMAAELISTTNEMTWAGTIRAYKTPLSLTQVEDIVDMSSPVKIMTDAVSGCTGIFNNATSSNSYASTVSAGVYTCSLNNAETFRFHDIRDAQYNDSTTIGYRQFGQNGTGAPSSVAFNGPIVGFGDTDSIVFVVEVPAGVATQSFFLRTWNTIEYQPTHGSLLYDFASNSPPEDPVAIAAYKAVATSLPVAVPYLENSNFWSRVRSLVVSGSRFFSHLPGPYGQLSKSVGSILQNFM